MAHLNLILIHLDILSSIGQDYGSNLIWVQI